MWDRVLKGEVCLLLSRILMVSWARAASDERPWKMRPNTQAGMDDSSTRGRPRRAIEGLSVAHRPLHSRGETPIEHQSPHAWGRGRIVSPS